MLYHLHHSGKRFENYYQNTERRCEHLFRDTKFTTKNREVHMHVQRSSSTLFFAGGNYTYESHLYEYPLSKITHALTN